MASAAQPYVPPPGKQRSDLPKPGELLRLDFRRQQTESHGAAAAASQGQSAKAIRMVQVPNLSYGAASTAARKRMRTGKLSVGHSCTDGQGAVAMHCKRVCVTLAAVEHRTRLQAGGGDRGATGLRSGRGRAARS